MLVLIERNNGAIWYRPEDNILIPGCKIYNSAGGWCCYCKDDVILKTCEDLDYDDFPMVESQLYSKLYEDDFSFMYELINPDTMGEHFLNNSFISERNPSKQLEHLLHDLGDEYIPIGVCMDDSHDHYLRGELWRPLVLTNDNYDRVYVHIKYEEWKQWADYRLQKNSSEL